MIKLRWLKSYQGSSIGKEFYASKKSAGNFVSQGYAEYIKEELIGRPDYKGFNEYILSYVLKDTIEQLQALEEGIKTFNVPRAEAKKILNGHIKQEEKAKKDYEKQDKFRLKSEKEAEEKADEQMKRLLLDKLEQTYKDCEPAVFEAVCEDDYRKAYYYLAERLMHDFIFKTFQDNGDIIKYESEQGIYSQNSDIFISQKIKEFLGEKALNIAVREITDSIRRSTYIERNVLFEQPKHIKPVKNGLWDIEQKKLLPFSPDYIFLDRIEIDYIATAEAVGFKKFLTEILDTDKEISVFQEWLGYCLLNDNRFQKALLCYGDGANGKSVLLKVVKQFLGAGNVANISLQHLESNTFALARLFGKSANIFFDLPKKALCQTSNFKIVVSGDSVSGEKKGKDSFEFIPYTKMMFSCNEVPRSPDRTPAFFRRWIILKFNQHFLENDPRRVENKEREFFTDQEMQGILIFALDGLDRLIKNRKFTEHLSQAEIEDFWLRHSDSVAAFVLDLIEQDLNSEESKSDVFTTYLDYCTLKGYTSEEQNHFWRRFKEIVPDCKEYQPKANEGQIRAIKGVKLKPLSSLNFGVSANGN